jgi:hypothetical protein
MTEYRANGTPAGFAPVCTHESEHGVANTHWECDECGARRSKTPAQVAFCAPSQAVSA